MDGIRKGEKMAVNVRPPVDERIVGKMSVKHSFVAIAIFSGMVWVTFFLMFRAVGEKDLSHSKQIIVLAVLGAWIVFSLCMAFVPRRKKLMAQSFAEELKKMGLHVRKAEQVTSAPYGSLPGAESVCSFVLDNESSVRALARLSYDAPDGNVDAIDRLGLVSVYFFDSGKKAAAAKAMLPPAGDRLEKKDGTAVRLIYSPDRMVFLYKNTLVYYNGRDKAVRAALGTLSDSGTRGKKVE